MRNLCVVAALTVGGALNATAQPPRAPTGLFLSAPLGAMVTVEGCVTRESGSAQIIAAGAPALAAATQFVLTQRTLPTDRTPARPLYMLIAQDGDAADFGQHLNHLVKVTGVVAAPKSIPPMVGRTPNSSPVPGVIVGATATPAGPITVPRLAVTTVVPMSDFCR